MERVFLNPDHSSQLLIHMSELWRREKFCDAALNLIGAKYKLHKLVLMAACPDILMILAHTEEGNLFDFYLPRDVEHYAVQAILGYFYDGAIQLKEGNICGVEKLSQLLQISELIQYCREFRSLMDSKSGAGNHCSDRAQEQGETTAFVEVPDSTTCGGIGGDGQNRVKEEGGASTSSSQLNLSQTSSEIPQTAVMIKREPAEFPSENASPFRSSKIVVVSLPQQLARSKGLVPTNLVCPGFNMQSNSEADLASASSFSKEHSAATSNIIASVMHGVTRSFSSIVSSPNSQSNIISRPSMGTRSSYEQSVSSSGNNILMSPSVERSVATITSRLSPGVARMSGEHSYSIANNGVQEMLQATGSSQKPVVMKVSQQNNSWTPQGGTFHEQLTAKLNQNQGSSKDTVTVPIYSQECVNNDHIVSSNNDNMESGINDNIEPANNDNETFVHSNPQERMVEPGLKSHFFSNNETPSHIIIPAIEPHFISTSQLSSPVPGTSELQAVMQKAEQIMMELVDSQSPPPAKRMKVITEAYNDPQGTQAVPRLQSQSVSNKELPAHSVTLRLEESHSGSCSSATLPLPGPSQVQTTVLMSKQNAQDQVVGLGPPTANKTKRNFLRVCTSNAITLKQKRSHKEIKKICYEESRERLKADRKSYAVFKRKDAERARIYRRNLSPDQKKKQAEGAKLRMQAMRQRRRKEGVNQKVSLDPDISVEDLDVQKKTRTRMSISRKNLPAEVKLKILESLEQIGLAATEKKFKVRESTIRGWKNKKDELIELSKKSMKRNRSRPPKLVSLDSVMKEWIAEEHKSKGRKIDRDEICSKAVGVAKECGIQNFSASQSWFRNFYGKFKTELETFISLKRPRSQDEKLIRKSYTRDFKLEVIKYAEKHRNYKAEREFGISESTIRDWIKCKSKLEKMDQHLKRCREGKPEYVELEQKVRDWVLPNQQNMKRKLTTVEIRNKACEFAVQMGVDSFRGRPSWYSAFIRRHKIDLEALRQKKQDSTFEEGKTKGASCCKLKVVEHLSPGSSGVQPSKDSKDVQKDSESEPESGTGDDDSRSNVGSMSEVYSRPHENSKKMSRFGRQFKPMKFDNSLVGDELSSELSDDEDDSTDDETKARKMQFEKEEEMLTLSDFDNAWEPTDSSEGTDEEEEKEN